MRRITTPPPRPPNKYITEPEEERFSYYIAKNERTNEGTDDGRHKTNDKLCTRRSEAAAVEVIN